MSQYSKEPEREKHPSWGVVTLHRTSCGPRGASLFQSDVLHREYMTLRVIEAERQRSLGGDHVYANGVPVIEVKLSMLQWAELVSSVNNGGGVPCTLDFVRTGPGVEVEPPPYIPRTLQSVKEVTDEADNLVKDIKDTFEAYMKAREEKQGKKALDDTLRSLRAAIENAVPNVKFTARRFEEHVDTVIQQAKSELRADAISTAKALGLPGEVDVSTLFGGNDTKELEA